MFDFIPLSVRIYLGIIGVLVLLHQFRKQKSEEEFQTDLLSYIVCLLFAILVVLLNKDTS